MPEAGKIPFKPIGDIQVATLTGLENVVIRISFTLDLRGHAVEALRAVFRAREDHIGDSAGDAPVAVVKWMDRQELEMCERRGQDRIGCRAGVQPRQKPGHFCVEPVMRRGLVTNLFPTEGTGNNLHRP